MAVHHLGTLPDDGTTMTATILAGNTALVPVVVEQENTMLENRHEM